MAAALLVGAAGCAGPGQAGQGPEGVVGAGRDRASVPLAGTEWQLTEVVEPSRTWRPPPEVDAVLRFDGDGGFSATVCNHYSGPVRVDGDVLQVGQTFGTSMGCGGVQGATEEAFVAVVRDEVGWVIDGDELRLDQPSGSGLRFRVRDTIYPSRDLQPLVRGQRNGGNHRFGWRAANGLVSLEWEWRDAPGKPWGVAGLSREPAWPVPRPDPLVGDAGKEQFVFGVVPRATARVALQPPDDRSPVDLQLFRLPGTGTWHAFGGLVGQTRGAVVIALDDQGRELGRSHRLGS